MPKTKICTKCKKEKSLKEFYKFDIGKFGVTPRCKECLREQGRIYKEGHKVERRNRLRDWRYRNPSKRKNQDLVNKYGITLDKYKEILEKQRGVCAICGKPETRIYKKAGILKSLSVDHDHINNRVRGLLCTNCNLMLGYSQDNITVLQNAISYLLENENNFVQKPKSC